MTNAHVDTLIDEDLAALRAYSPDYDVDRGAKRLALATAAVAVGTLGAGLGSSGLSGVTKGAAWSAALKLLGLIASTGSVALVALSPEMLTSLPEHAALVTDAECLLDSARPSTPLPLETSFEPSVTPIVALLAEEEAAVPTPRVALTGGRRHPRPLKNAAFERDVAALERAKTLARTNPSGALENPVPPGRFVEEHEIIAIRALVAMNRRDEARARIDRFLSEHPQSAFSDTVRGLRSAAPTATVADPSRSSSESPIAE